MNPQGQWIIRSAALWRFEAPEYGRVEHVPTAGLPYFWVRTDARDGVQPISGYAPGLAQAQKIVETLLWETETVKVGYG